MLDLSKIYLRQLQKVDDNVTVLKCNENSIRQLHVRKSKLIKLYCNDNRLKSLHIPNTLKILDCRNNHHLSKIQLNEGLEELYCRGTQLSPSLPKSLQILECDDPPPQLNEGLKKLSCWKLKKTKLPKSLLCLRCLDDVLLLNDGLEELVCKGITDKTILPQSLLYLETKFITPTSLQYTNLQELSCYVCQGTQITIPQSLKRLHIRSSKPTYYVILFDEQQNESGDNIIQIIGKNNLQNIVIDVNIQKIINIPKQIKQLKMRNKCRSTKLDLLETIVEDVHVCNMTSLLLPQTLKELTMCDCNINTLNLSHTQVESIEANGCKNLYLPNTIKELTTDSINIFINGRLVTQTIKNHTGTGIRLDLENTQLTKLDYNHPSLEQILLPLTLQSFNCVNNNLTNVNLPNLKQLNLKSDSVNIQRCDDIKCTNVSQNNFDLRQTYATSICLQQSYVKNMFVPDTLNTLYLYDLIIKGNLDLSQTRLVHASLDHTTLYELIIPDTMQTLQCTNVHMNNSNIGSSQLKKLNYMASRQKIQLPPSLEWLNINICFFDELDISHTRINYLNCPCNDLKTIKCNKQLKFLLCSNVQYLDLTDTQLVYLHNECSTPILLLPRTIKQLHTKYDIYKINGKYYKKTNNMNRTKVSEKYLTQSPQKTPQIRRYNKFNSFNKSVKLYNKSINILKRIQKMYTQLH